jgi:hypothetical protein
MPRIRPIQRPGKLALMQRVIENKRRRIEDVDRNKDGDQSIAVSLLPMKRFTTVYSSLLDANFFNLLYKSDRPRPDELLPEYQGNIEEVADATVEDDMMQLAEQARGSIELAEYQEVSHMDSMLGGNENEDIGENDTPSFEEYQEIRPIDSIPSDNEDEDEDIQTIIPSAPVQSPPISISLPPIPPTNSDGFYSSDPIHHIQK